MATITNPVEAFDSARKCVTHGKIDALFVQYKPEEKSAIKWRSKDPTKIPPEAEGKWKVRSVVMKCFALIPHEQGSLIADGWVSLGGVWVHTMGHSFERKPRPKTPLMPRPPLPGNEQHPKIEVEVLNEDIIPLHVPKDTLLQKLWRLRGDIQKHQLRRLISTRAVIAAAKMKKGGWGDETILTALTQTWTEQERAKCGVGSQTLKGTAEERVLELAEMGLNNIYLAGPAGSGKSTLADTVATKLKRPFVFMSFSADTSSASLVGFAAVDGKWKESTFVHGYESGAVILLDEMDAASADVLVAVNSALANGRLAIPRHHEKARRVINRHKDTIILAAANTWGSGPTAQYVGRSALDAATLDRFVGAQVFMDYNEALERKLFDELCGDTE